MEPVFHYSIHEKFSHKPQNDTVMNMKQAERRQNFTENFFFFFPKTGNLGTIKIRFLPSISLFLITEWQVLECVFLL